MNKVRVTYGLVAILSAAISGLAVQPAAAWRGGGGGHYAEASNGHWVAAGGGHVETGTWGTTAGGTHDAADARGGTMEAGHESWPTTSASGRTNSGTYGTSGDGTHYDTGSYGGTVAVDGQHYAMTSNGYYAYGTAHVGSAAAADGAYHPPAVANQYYGTGCWDCGGWAALGVPAPGGPVAAASATPPPAAAPAAAVADVSGPVSPDGYAYETIYAALPGMCVSAPVNGMMYFHCSNTWFAPGYGANGTWYRVVPPP